jgi:hypothetical protein
MLLRIGSQKNGGPVFVIKLKGKAIASFLTLQNLNWVYLLLPNIRDVTRDDL